MTWHKGLKYYTVARIRRENFIGCSTIHYLPYVSHRIPEISDELYKIDNALKAGFGWEMGAFESWDALGVKKTLEQMKTGGFEVAEWV